MEIAVRILLFLLAILASLLGGVIMVIAESALHEIQASISFLISAVLISGAGIVEAVNFLRKDLVSLGARINPR